MAKDNDIDYKCPSCDKEIVKKSIIVAPLRGKHLISNGDETVKCPNPKCDNYFHIVFQENLMKVSKISPMNVRKQVS